MLLNAARERRLDLTASFMIGDRWRDIEAGRRAGSKTFFIDYRYDERRPETYDYCVKSLREAASIIISDQILFSGQYSGNRLTGDVRRDQQS